MNLWPPHTYLSQGRKLQVPDPVLQEALRQARDLQGRGLPAILTLNHLAVRTETPYKDLRSYVEREEDPYRVFKISKRSGGKRRICIPTNSLLRVQRWLARNLLNHVTPHRASGAYAPGASPVQCALMHCGCTWLLKVDVTSFFESISEIQVYRVFGRLGYNPLVSFEMARLCTRAPKHSGPRRAKPQWRSKWLGMHSIHSYENLGIGHLPQGAPTSPMLSNLAMLEIDGILEALAAGAGLVYTRYADDLAFSTASTAFTRADAVQFLKSVHSHLRAVGLQPNRKKTTIAPPGARKVILGLLVDGTQPRLRREFKQKLLSHAYFLRKYGVAQHAQKRGFRSRWAMRRHIEGLISYARQVEPAFADLATREFNHVDWGPLEDPARQ